MVVNRDTNERSARRATVSKWKRWEFVLPRQRPKAFPRMYRPSHCACRQVVHHGCAYYMQAGKVASQVSSVKSLARSVAFVSRKKAKGKLITPFCSARLNAHCSASRTYDMINRERPGHLISNFLGCIAECRSR